MISSSGNANVLRPKRNGNGLSCFTSDARITSFWDDVAVRGRCTIQIDHPIRYEFKGFAVLSVVVEERLLSARIPRSLPMMPPDNRFEPGRGEPDHRKPRYSAMSFNPLENVGK